MKSAVEKREKLTREIMKNLLVFIDVNWAEQSDVFDYINALKVEALDKQIQVLTSTKSAIGLIPQEVFNDVEQPQQCIQAINDVLDQLITREEYGS